MRSKKNMKIQRVSPWSRADLCSSSTDSEDSRPSFIECKSYDSKRGSDYSINSQSSFHCKNGHSLVLQPIVREREATCGACEGRIKLKTVHILSFHCVECNYNCCSNCISDEMKVVLLLERSKLMSSKMCCDIQGEGIFKGQLCIAEKRQGHGVMTWCGEDSKYKGCSYEGNYENDMRHGYGKYTYADGGVYEGLWKDDKKCGYGRRSYSNGYKYNGLWKDDMKEGKGIFKGITGRWCMAVWKDDEMVSPGKFPPKIKPSNNSLE